MRRALVCLLMVAVPVGGAVLPAGTAGAATSPDCYSAINVWWPAQHRAWAKRIAARESGYLQGRAANPKSSAKGCMQLLHSLHAWRYDRVGFGCNRNRWRNNDCSILAARHLFLQAGTRPWAVTRYTR